MARNFDDQLFAKLYYGANSAVELDAIDPKVLQKMITEAIVGHIDSSIWEETQMEQKEGREKIKGFIAAALGVNEAKREAKKKRESKK